MTHFVISEIRVEKLEELNVFQRLSRGRYLHYKKGFNLTKKKTWLTQRDVLEDLWGSLETSEGSRGLGVFGNSFFAFYCGVVRGEVGVVWLRDVLAWVWCPDGVRVFFVFERGLG